MNKIVIRHFPASRLPAELRGDLDAATEVTVTVETELDLSQGASLEELLAIKKTLVPADDDPAERIRKLRDAWD